MKKISYISKFAFTLFWVALAVFFLPSCITPLIIKVQPPLVSIEVPVEDVK